jgi:hypothetical protein
MIYTNKYVMEKIGQRLTREQRREIFKKLSKKEKQSYKVQKNG